MKKKTKKEDKPIWPIAPVTPLINGQVQKRGMDFYDNKNLSGYYAAHWGKYEDEY